jgi:hypothetical protein
MSILKDRIRPLDPSSNQEFLEPDREAGAEGGSPRAHEAAPAGQLHAVTRDAEGLGTGE